jgi:phage-related protein (TIGR01555 family)
MAIGDFLLVIAAARGLRLYYTRRLQQTLKIMFKSFASTFFQSRKKADLKKAEAEKESRKEIVSHDPLDPLKVLGRAASGNLQRAGDRADYTIRDFPLSERMPEGGTLTRAVMDSAKTYAKIGDDTDNSIAEAAIGLDGLGVGSYGVPGPIMAWYGAQSFIGYQACAILAQNWLIDKACTMSGDDACRNGWNIKSKGDADLETEDHDALRARDVEFRLMENLSAFNRFRNIFGIRVAFFVIESEDKLYYEKPFNIDGITPGSYKGISQVDPYWMMPVMTMSSTADPANMYFYDPEFWVISGKKYHRSHLIISRGPEVADILKPSYIFGGIPLTQRIYERVYAAERTANEAPLLSMSKRTTALHVDLDAMAANQDKFEERLALWIQYRDNHGVKVLGKEETIEQMDTSLADFDSVIMNQYQLVAAIAETPATEILGTSPKGFNATGEFEMKSYNKKLTSIQTHTYDPLLDRHYMLQAKSMGIDVEIDVVWNPTDTPTAQEQAELNDKKADIDTKQINNGAISSYDIRNRLKDDELSGYNRLQEEEEDAGQTANETPGMSPENLAKLQTSSAKEETGSAAETTAGVKPPAGPGAAPTAAPADEGAAGPTAPPAIAPAGPAKSIENTPEAQAKEAMARLLRGLMKNLGDLDDELTPEGGEPGKVDNGRARTVKPGVRAIQPGVSSVQDVIPKMDPSKLPKIKMNGMVISIENHRGSIRQGQTVDGTRWANKMPDHYGFFKGVQGADGDELDCFVGPNAQAPNVYVINQHDQSTNEFDEHKVMTGFDSPEQAMASFKASRDVELHELDEMYEMNVQDFKNWASTPCTDPMDGMVPGARKKAVALDD